MMTKEELCRRVAELEDISMVVVDEISATSNLMML